MPREVALLRAVIEDQAEPLLLPLRCARSVHPRVPHNVLKQNELANLFRSDNRQGVGGRVGSNGVEANRVFMKAQRIAEGEDGRSLKFAKTRTCGGAPWAVPVALIPDEYLSERTRRLQACLKALSQAGE
jgi:hypothetical protein